MKAFLGFTGFVLFAGAMGCVLAGDSYSAVIAMGGALGCFWFALPG